MTQGEHAPDRKSLSPEEIRAGTAALAEHLTRCGVHYLPRPQPEAVQRLVESLGLTATETQPATDSVPERDAPETTPGAAAPVRRVARQPSPGAAERAGGGAAITGDAEPYPGAELGRDERQAALESMAAEVAACTRCPVLVKCRRQTVFGEGNPTPRVVFFGEGPGGEEDRTGRPFVGRAGELLTKMIEACTFRRDDVYILNTVKCRPPDNRNPEPAEIENCREYFERQLAILRPEYIVCLGAVSSRALLGTTLSVGRLRGRMHRHHTSKVIVTYHPAYLLRNPAAKRAAWDDLKLMLHDAGIDTAR